MRLKAVVRSLPPAYFAMVMATGIVSIALHEQGVGPGSWFLFGLNVLFYVVLNALHGLRLCWFPRECLRELSNANIGPGYFTWVAATSVLGSQFMVLARAPTVAVALLALAALVWPLLNAAVFTALAVRRNKSSLIKGINGGWLVGVVAMQSLAVLSTLIADQWRPMARLELHFLAVVLWLAGGMLYIWLSSLIFYRLYFVDFGPAELLPTYWINMGAMAISTLAGSMLIATSTHDAPYLEAMRPFLYGFTLFYWAGGNWWIPVLFALSIWRHVACGYRFIYSPLHWGMVFPLGMYSVATQHMSHVMHLSFLWPLARGFAWLGLLAWLATVVAFLIQQGRRLQGRRRAG